MYKTPPSSPRKLEEKRLRTEANGTIAPAKSESTFFNAIREDLINAHVKKELDKSEQKQDGSEKPLNHP